jgi:hypothetical protein
VETGLGYPPWIGGSALLLFSIAMTAGRMLIGAGHLRRGSFQVMTGSRGLSALLFFRRVPTGPAAGFAGSYLWPTMLAVTADRYPQVERPCLARSPLSGTPAESSCPWIVGWIADRRSIHWSIAVSAAAPATMLLLVAALRRNGTTD